jgi:hypothetical protein
LTRRRSVIKAKADIKEEEYDPVIGNIINYGSPNYCVSLVARSESSGPEAGF